MGSSHVLSAFQITAAVVALPVESPRPKGVVRLAPVALFQLLRATTPAISVLPMATPFPTNWMLIGLPDVLDVVTTSVTVAVCVSEPLVPVIVSVGLPIGVLLVVVTVSVEDPAPVTDVGENNAVAPAGRPLVTLKLTAPLKPLCAPTLTVYVAVPPGFTENELGAPASVKFGGPVTFSVTVAVCVSEPLVPVIVSVGLPIGVLLVVVTVSVEDPAPVTDVGENDAVAPVGSPLVTLKLTAPPNPFSTPRFTVYVVLPPAATVCVPGVADIVKSGANTVKATVAVCVTAPLVPVIVSVGLPAGVFPAVIIVKIELPGALREAGANVAVAPVGRPLALRLTDPVNPLMAPTLTVYVVLPPALTVWVLGVADTVKSGLGTIWIPLIGA